MFTIGILLQRFWKIFRFYIKKIK